MLIKHINLLVFFTALFFVNIQAESAPLPPATAVQTPQTSTESQKIRNQEKYEILKRDQIDTTSTLAIPFDDSEVEDEEEIDRLEKKEVFSLPHSN